ncbi:unnamed protein product [Arctia plantaginis]|uniref:Uncharacterized protein n=1 Tax=Arctia plantaginis TaxID=874455 RepID=A0A8S0Z3E3_ARCPL|nr:unnamed protein product [Arctia plantaginis]
MAMSLIILAIFINQVNLQTSVATFNAGSEVNSLSERLKGTKILQTQNQEIQTPSETTPAAPTGNNLNAIGSTTSTSLDVPEKNFQAIFTIFSQKNKKSNDENHSHAGNFELFFNENIARNNDDYLESSKNNQIAIKSESLVWDNCLETSFKDSPLTDVKNQDMQNDNHDHYYQDNKEIGLWQKRDTGNFNLNSTAGQAWLKKYNNLLNSKSEERRPQKSDTSLVKKMPGTPTSISTVLPTSTIRIIPITREVFKEQVNIFNTTDDITTDSDIGDSYTEDWFEEKDGSKIRFGGLPQKEKYLLPSLKLDEAFHPFSFMSEFFYLIYPFDFPVGK